MSVHVKTADDGARCSWCTPPSTDATHEISGEAMQSAICRECAHKLIQALGAMLVMGGTKESRASMRRLRSFFK